MDIKKVVIIGATGAVGKTVSGVFASFGNAKVYMLGRDLEKLEQARHDAALSVKAITIMDNLYIDTLDNLDKYLKDVDLVFASVAENLEIKKDIHNRINKHINNKAIISTGTSGLSINELVNCYDEDKRQRFIGIHFFNPPYSLPLCELIPSRYNENDFKFIESLKKYLDFVLLRDTIIVKDEPAFLANRIGFMFMNEALQYAVKYKDAGGIDYIDSILGGFTGRNMKPIETVDFVGLDIHRSIVDNVRCNSKENDKESFKLPDFVNELIKEGMLGKKTNGGLYKKIDNDLMVYDINTKNYRKAIKYSFPFINKLIKELSNGNYIEGYNLLKNDSSLESSICMTFLLRYIIYSIKITKSVCNDITYCDNAMVDGFNWVPPLSLIDILGGKEEVIKLSQKYLKEDIHDIIKDLPKSKYDYRKYIKAKV